MRLNLRFLLVAGAICAAPLLAQNKNQTSDLAAMTDAQLLDAAERGERGKVAVCRSVVYADELERRQPNRSNKALAARRRGTCAWLSDKFADAVRELEVAEKLLIASDPQRLRATLDLMLVWSAAELKDQVALESHALHVARRNDPDEFAEADIGIWRYAIMQAAPEVRGRIALAFAKATSFPRLQDRMRGMMGYQAIKPALAAGNAKLAFTLATLEPDPDSMVSMLIDRSYAKLWPRLEQHVGPKLAKELAANIAQAERELAESPDDLAKLAAVVRAKLWLNRPAEAVAVAQRADHSPRAFANASEEFGWLINAEVKALDMLSQHDLADALFDRLVGVGVGVNRGWMVNFAINRADRLVGQGRWAEALPAADLAVSIAGKHGSPYAKEVAAVDRYCAAIKLDPARAVLADWWAEIEAGRLANIGAAVQAAQCKGNDAAARRFFRDGLLDEGAREQALALMQPRAVELARDEGNMFAEPRLLFERDAALVALFSRYGRVLPKALEPEPYRP